MTFLRNAWYMFGWRDELPEGGMLARTVLDEPIVVYRNVETGSLVALHDRCPHRFAPLSRGRLEGTEIRCGYHGLKFDCEGACTENPFNRGAIPRAAKVRSFPVVEAPGTIWVWTGDPHGADVALIPDIAYHADPAMRYVKGVTTVASDYRLLSDNLMDLTHATFLHPAFGGWEYMPRFRSEERPDGSVVSDYTIDDMVNIYEGMIEAERIRVRDTIRWIAPSTHLLDSYGGLRGEEDWQVYVPSAHILTPETATSTHYFWSSGVEKDSPMPDEELHAILQAAFDTEDKPMVEAVQSRMQGKDLFELDPVLLPTDAGGIRMRRKLAALIAAEQAHEGPPVAAARPVPDKVTISSCCGTTSRH